MLRQFVRRFSNNVDEKYHYYINFIRRIQYNPDNLRGDVCNIIELIRSNPENYNRCFEVNPENRIQLSGFVKRVANNEIVSVEKKYKINLQNGKLSKIK
jgi:hypothetical protein